MLSRFDMRLLGTVILIEALIAFGLLTEVSCSQGLSSAGQQGNSSQRRRVWVVSHQLVSKICGRSVENRDGQYLGRVHDFILDKGSGEVRYVVISFDGWFGFGQKLRVVPAKLVSTATAKVGVVSVDAGRRRWERAPIFSKTDLDRFNKEPADAQALDRYYAPSSVITHRSASENSSNPVPTGRIDSTPVQLQFSRDIVGKQVVRPRGERLGEISDLLIDLPGSRPTLAILARSKLPGSKDRFAFVFGSLEKLRAGTFQVDATPESFADAKPLDDTSWQTPGTPNATIIYRYLTTRM